MGKQAGCRVDPAEGQLQGFKAAGREAGATGLRTRMSGPDPQKKNRGKAGAQCLGPQKFMDWCAQQDEKPRNWTRRRSRAS